jgi:hypothetical protein
MINDNNARHHMGFFSKIKDNLQHGGVKVHVTAPATAHRSDPSLSMQVTLTNNSEPRVIKSVHIALVSSAPIANGANVSTNTNSREVVAQQSFTQEINLAADEVRTLEISLPLGAQDVLAAALPDNPLAEQLGNAFQALQTVAAATSGRNLDYRIEVSADVDGIAIDPSDSLPINMLAPGEIGTGFNFHL